MSRERFEALKSVTLTETLCRTRHVTQPLVIMLWTVGPAITQVVSVCTNSAGETAVKTRACHNFTIFLIFMVQAVVPTITPCVHREAVNVITRAGIVSFRAVLIITHHFLSE